MSQPKFTSIPARNATRRINRVQRLLAHAGKHLYAASKAAPDKYNADRLRSLAEGLRQLCIPLSIIAGRFQKGGEL